MNDPHHEFGQGLVCGAFILAGLLSIVAFVYISLHP